MTLPLAKRTLPRAEYRVFRTGAVGQHVWFWHLYDGKPITIRDSLSPRAALATAMEYGFKRDGPRCLSALRAIGHGHASEARNCSRSFSAARNRKASETPAMLLALTLLERRVLALLALVLAGLQLLASF